MKYLFALFLAVCASTAQSACYADYKAKQDEPLRLQYGVARIDGPCNPDDAADELKARLTDVNWVLLNIVSLFDEDGLEERRESAGEFYLRF